MKILLAIHENLEPNSGSAGSTWKLGQEYQKMGHQVNYYSFDNLPQQLSPLAKEIFFPLFLTAYAYKVREELDIIDASTGDNWILAKTIKKPSFKRPVLVTRSHGLEHMKHLADKEDVYKGNLKFSWKYPLYRGSIQLWQVKQSLLSADLVYLLNTKERNYVTKKFEISSKSTHVFPNGIPDSFLNLPVKSLFTNQKTDEVQIAVIGTFIARKGIKYSVPALNQILIDYPRVRVSFLGTECRECPDKEQVYAGFVPAVRDRINVIPRYQHDQLPQLLQGHQIKLLPSLSEGFGKALIEAMACGLVPIATTTPGPSDIIEDQHNGILIPPRNSTAIKQALKKLIDDPAYLNQLRCNAYQTAQEYSWNSIAKNRLDTYFQSLLEI